MTCSGDGCEREITSLKGCAYEEIGWVLPRDSGGTHHLLRKRRTGRMLCSDCTFRMRYGVGADQLQIPIE